MIETNLTQSRVEKYNREGTWFQLTLSDLVDRAARAFPDKVFLTDSRRKITYGQFCLITKRVGIRLHQLGVKREDRVGIQLPDSIENFATLIATTRIGALPVPINHQFRQADLIPLLEFAKPVAMAIPSNFRNFEYIPLYRELQLKSPWLKHIFVSDAKENLERGMFHLEQIMEEPFEKAHSDNYLEQFKPEPNDLCLILLTSGTTAVPKAVMHTHNTWIFGPVNVWAQVGLRPDDVLLNLMPMFGSSSLTFLTAVVFNKASVVMMDRFKGEEALKLAAKEKVSVIGGVAAHFIGMLNSPNFENYDLCNLRLACSAGGPVTAVVAREIETRMKCRTNFIWGTSETKGGTQTLLTDPDDIRLGTVGRPEPYVEVKAVDADGNELPAGEAGELLVRGPSNFVGYYNNRDLNQKAIDRDGWFRTGDVGVFDKNRNLTIVGRITDMILRGGENIYPREIEELLAKHPKVKDVAIIAAPDKRLGEIVCACIIPKEGTIVTFDEVVSFLKGKVEVHKLPEMVEVLDKFPMTDAGKVIKAKLREQLVGKLSGEGKI